MPLFGSKKIARAPRGAICPAIPTYRPVGTAGQRWAAFRDPTGVYPAEVAADQARAASRAAYPDLAETDTVRDAYRHFYWVSAMTRLLGPDRARAFANSHEAEYPIRTEADRRSRQMDTYNNEAAIRMTLDPRWQGKPTDVLTRLAIANNCLDIIKK